MRFNDYKFEKAFALSRLENGRIVQLGTYLVVFLTHAGRIVNDMKLRESHAEMLDDFGFRFIYIYLYIY